MSDAISAAAVFVPQTPSGDETRRRLSGKSAHEVAKEFEAVLLAQVISAMRKTVPDSGMVEASSSRKMLDGAFDQEVARSLAAKGGLGIAEQIVGQIERQHGLGHAQIARDAAAETGTGTLSARGTSAGSRTARTATVPVASASLGQRPHASVASTATAERVVGAAGAETRRFAGSSGPSTAAVASSAAVLPVAGEISSPFGMRSDPFTGEPRFHAGVDVAAPRGSEIRAVADGEVVFSGWRRGGAGRVVEVRHADGLVTSYAHAERTLVRVGQHVGAGDPVATVGSSGRASGPHLHFAASRDGQAVNPSGLLEQGRSVVGPLASVAGTT